ncbi:MAG: ribosome-associated translation inhibitor RaiA [Bacteroidales bacterium]|nr:ribosome-associated translation inhibitor RaiA [Bacteroidales bacterium]
MKININSVKFKTDKKLEDFIHEKIGKLYANYDNLMSADVTLRLENSSNQENKIAEIRLNVPGNDLFAKKQCKTFEEAIDLSTDALKKQLAKNKEKTQ